jgi:Tfp pilus assembly protein PilE
MINLRKNRGVTLMILVVTIIVLIILAGISLTEGTNLIKTSKVESLMTNMITIKAKSKVFADEINAQIWDLSDDAKAETRAELFKNDTYKMADTTITSEQISQLDPEVTNGNYEYYSITKETLDKMGLSDIDDENYVVVYNSEDYTKLDIIYKNGIEYNNKMYYSLYEIQKEIGE